MACVVHHIVAEIDFFPLCFGRSFCIRLLVAALETFDWKIQEYMTKVLQIRGEVGEKVSFTALIGSNS